MVIKCSRLCILCFVAAVTALPLFIACAPGSGEQDHSTQAEPAAARLEAPTLDELANATYEGIFDDPVSLSDGEYEGEPFEPGAASRPAAGLVEDFRLTGDLNGDQSEEAVVLLWENSGGTGIHDYLAIVGHRSGEITNVGTALIGDRVQVQAARVVDGQIVLQVIQAGPEDAACCPSQKMTRTWALSGDGLSEISSEVTGTLSLSDLAGVEWVLTHISWDEPAPPEPEVTLSFEADRISGRGGCNTYFASVEAGGMPGWMTVGTVGSTQMVCPETIMALERRYLKAFAGEVQYRFLAGRLVLTSTQEGVTTSMRFAAREAKAQ